LRSPSSQVTGFNDIGSGGQAVALKELLGKPLLLCQPPLNARKKKIGFSFGL
jgi:hypothetical protein